MSPPSRTPVCWVGLLNLGWGALALMHACYPVLVGAFFQGESVVLTGREVPSLEVLPVCNQRPHWLLLPHCLASARSFP